MAKSKRTQKVDAKAAVIACRMLVEAYAKGKEDGGSVDWSDVDAAYQIARGALGLNR